MSGDWLALGAVGMLAVAGAARRGSRSVETAAEQAVKRPKAYERVEATGRVTLATLQQGESWPYSVFRAERGTMKGGRIVVDPQFPIAGLVWSMKSGTPVITHVWVQSYLHRKGIGRKLLDLYRRHVSVDARIVGPFSTSGRAFAKATGSAQRQAIEQRVVTRGGWPWPEQTVLYHGTYAMGAIERQGFRVRTKGAPSMMGGGHTVSVSTTLLPQRAASIALALDTLGRVAHRNLSLVDLVHQLSIEAPKSIVDAVTGFSDWVRNLRGPYDFYSVEAYDQILINLYLLDKDWTYVSLVKPPEIGRPYIVPKGAIAIEGQEDSYLVPPGSALPLTSETLMQRAVKQIPNNSDRSSWAYKRTQGYAHGRCDAAFRIYKAVLGVGDMSHHECFNPYLMNTNVAALGRVPLDSIGVLLLRTEISRICTDELGAIRLGYLEHHDPIRQDKMRSWYADCDNVLTESRGYDGELLYPGRSETDLFGLWDRYLQDESRWQGWSIRQQGDRTRKSTMLYYDGEEEVRIFDPTRISVAEVWSMGDVRRQFDLGDRLTFPWFDARRADVRVWNRDER